VARFWIFGRIVGLTCALLAAPSLLAACSAAAANVGPATPVDAGTHARRTSADIALSLPTPFPLYSSYFTGATPFHQTVAALLLSGATVQSATVASNFLAQGFVANQPYNPDSGGGPIYVAQSGDPGYLFLCPEYGGCPVSGMTAHYPAGATPAIGSDHHLTSFDPVYTGGEIDGWGGYGCSGNLNPVVPTGACAHPCNLTPGNPGIANCSYGGFASFSGNGLGNGGNAAGYSYGLFQVSAQDLLQGHIDHALGMVAGCLDNGGVFPAARGTDHACPSNLEPNAVYGDLIHLKFSVVVAAYGYSPYCAIVVQALQTYGAYTTDTDGGYGDGIEFENPNNPIYAQNNPWPGIYASMAAGGDSTGTSASHNVSFSSCLQRIKPSDLEVIQIPSTISGPLPIIGSL
jgi:hypothetical protein